MTAMPPPPPPAPGHGPGPTGSLPTLDVSQTAAIPFGRLVVVEWRKLVDTRAGLWLFLALGAVLGLVSTIVLILAAFADAETTASGLMTAYRFAILLLLPVAAIMTVTTEWSQRTALTSFTLDPRRPVVIAAKWAAVTGFALAVLVIALVLGAVVNVAAAALAGTDVIWDLEASALVWTVAQQMIYFWLAFALAMAFLNTPAAIAVYYLLVLIWPMIVLPLVLALIGGLAGLDGIFDALPWFDLFNATTPLAVGEGWDGGDPEASDYLHFFVTSAWWLGIPAALGMRRIARAEVK